MNFSSNLRSAALLALATASALALASCGGASHDTAERDLGPAVNVTVLRATSGSPDALVLPARVTAREEVTLTARLGARLTSLPLREGDRFRRGQTLATFDAPETRAQLDGARAGLAAATVARDMARRQEARMDSLYSNRVAALRELEGAQAERRGAEAAWAQAKAMVDGLQSGATLEAPFDGVVVRRHADVGVTVGPGMPLMDIRSSDVGEITASVPESELSRLAGAGASGAPRAEYQIGDGDWSAATLVRVDGMTDANTRSRVARFRPANGAALEAGAFARVKLSGGASGASGAAAPATPVALRVPTSALVTRGGLTGVFVAEGDVARLRWLRVGRANGGTVEVLAGLASDDAVIVDPKGLADGRKVKVAS